MKKQVKIKLTNSILALWCLGIVYAAFNLQKVSDVDKNEAIDFLRVASILMSAVILFCFNFSINKTEWTDAFLPSFLGLMVISLVILSLATDYFFYTVAGWIFCFVLVKLSNENR